MANPPIPMRSEIKYLVPNARLDELRQAIMPMMGIDKYCLDYAGRGYTVRSIYLDTPRLLYYREKIDGLKKRKKLRVRAYNVYQEDSKVFLEIKRKEGSRIAKTRGLSTLHQLPQVLSLNAQSVSKWQIAGSQKNAKDISSFLFHLHQQHLQSVNLVVYEREAFEGKINPGLRVTFDRNLRSKLTSNPTQLFEEDNLSLILPDHFILEVKYNHTFPRWMTPILSNFSLQKQALSKYCMSLERCTGLQGQELLLSLSTRYRNNPPFDQQAEQKN